MLHPASSRHSDHQHLFSGLDFPLLHIDWSTYWLVSSPWYTQCTATLCYSLCKYWLKGTKNIQFKFRKVFGFNWIVFAFMYPQKLFAIVECSVFHCGQCLSSIGYEIFVVIYCTALWYSVNLETSGCQSEIIRTKSNFKI